MAEETAGALNLALSTAFLLSQTVGEFTTTQTLLEPLANVLRCQLPVVKRLVENIKVYEKYYNADHFINSLLVYQETLKGIRILLEKLNDQSFWIQIWSSKQNKLEMDILIKSFQLASNSLQLGFQIDDLGKVMDEKFKDYKISNNDRSNDQLRQLSAVNKDFEKKFQRYQESVTASRANYNSSSRSPRDDYLEAYYLFYARTPDYDSAFKLFQKCKQLPESRYYLGVCYLYGYGTSVNRIKAKAYLQYAWSHVQTPGAMLELGRLYESEGDKMEAFRHYLVAATFGLPRACEKIAVMYENGDVIHDVNEALRWQSKAVASSTLRT